MTALSELGRRTLVMGVINVTPDSFSDGGQFLAPADAVDHGLSLLDAGADILDVGGESTRPGAGEVSAGEEKARIVPVIHALAEMRPDAVLSIDTRKATVAEAAIDAGAAVVNDVSGFGFDPDMPALCAERGVYVVLMHIRGTPETMQRGEIVYDDVVDDICDWLAERIALAVEAGVDERRIIVDPGIGFGKTVRHNLDIIRRLDEFRRLGCPVLIGTSRKRFIGELTDRAQPDERTFGTAATVALSVASGADVVRVHDVAEMVDVVRVADALVR